jgi:hypothetical protein
MKIVDQLADLGIIEVSSHGLRKNYFEPTAAQCSSTTNAQGTQGAAVAEAPVHKKNVILKASTVKGTLANQVSGTMVATLRDVDNEPIAGQEIIFVESASRQELGRATTDGSGTARCDTGSRVSDIQGMIGGAVSGYKAIYEGSKQYYPAEAVGKFEAGPW